MREPLGKPDSRSSLCRGISAVSRLVVFLADRLIPFVWNESRPEKLTKRKPRRKERVKHGPRIVFRSIVVPKGDLSANHSVGLAGGKLLSAA